MKMSIYEITKLDDNVHVQKKTPNPQIYKLFEMGAELEQVVDSLDPGHGGDYYTKEEVDSKLANKQNTLTFDNIPTADSTNPVTSGGIEVAISDEIKTIRFKVVGSNTSYTTVTVPANNVLDLDISNYIESRVPSGYQLLCAGAVFVESLNTIDVIPVFAFEYNGYKIRLRNINATNDASINNMWISVVVKKI